MHCGDFLLTKNVRKGNACYRVIKILTLMTRAKRYATTKVVDSRKVAEMDSEVFGLSQRLSDMTLQIILYL